LFIVISSFFQNTLIIIFYPSVVDRMVLDPFIRPFRL